jgi:hypothetical protein
VLAADFLTMKSSFLIVADRGNLKAYRVEAVPNGRAPRVHLVQAFTLPGAHLKISEVNTDQAGRFPVGSTPAQSQGRHQNSIAERHYEIETGKRLARRLAEHIEDVLKQEQPRNWSFAAPSEINHAILDELEPSYRSNIAENLPLDLVNLPPHELLDRFSVRAVEAA